MEEPKAFGSPASVMHSFGSPNECMQDPGGQDFGNDYDEYYKNPFASLLNSPTTVEKEFHNEGFAETAEDPSYLEDSETRDSIDFKQDDGTMNELKSDTGVVGTIQPSFLSSKDDDEYSATTQDDDEILRKLNEEDEADFIVNKSSASTAIVMDDVNDFLPSFNRTRESDFCFDASEDELVLQMLNDEYDSTEVAFTNAPDHRLDHKRNNISRLDNVTSAIDSEPSGSEKGPEENVHSLSNDIVHDVKIWCITDDEMEDTKGASVVDSEPSGSGKDPEEKGVSFSNDIVHNIKPWYIMDDENQNDVVAPVDEHVQSGLGKGSEEKGVSIPNDIVHNVKPWYNLNPFDDDSSEHHVDDQVNNVYDYTFSKDIDYDDNPERSFNPFDDDSIASQNNEHHFLEVMDTSLFSEVNVPVDDSNFGDFSPEEYRDGSEEESYDEKRERAKQQLWDEIRMADVAKSVELSKLRAELFESDKLQNLSEDTGISIEAESDDAGYVSFDDCDTNPHEKSDYSPKDERRQDRNTVKSSHVLAALDIKLSQIQLLQSIILAEEAALRGKREFKTADVSLEELNNVYIPADILKEKTRVEKMKDLSQMVIHQTIIHAKASQTHVEKQFKSLRESLDEQLTMGRVKTRHSVTVPHEDDKIGTY